MEDKDWNYDRIVSAQAQISQAQSDMMTILNRGYVRKGMKDRMVEFLRMAADDIDRMKTQ